VATDSFISDQRSFGSKGQHQEEITPELRQMADSVVRSGGAVAAVRMTTFGEIKQTTAATAKASRPSTATQRMETAFWQYWRRMMPCGERPVVAEKMRNRMATKTLTITHNYLADPSHWEEMIAARSVVTMALNVHGELCLLDYGGGCEVHPKPFIIPPVPRWNKHCNKPMNKRGRNVYNDRTPGQCRRRTCGIGTSPNCGRRSVSTTSIGL